MRYLVLATVYLSVVLPVYADEPQAGDTPKELMREVHDFMRQARASMQKWDRVADQVGPAVYASGAKDGALCASVALIVIYLVFLRQKVP